MRMGQGVRTGFGHGGITCVLQTQFSRFSFFFFGGGGGGGSRGSDSPPPPPPPPLNNIFYASVTIVGGIKITWTIFRLGFNMG